MRTQTDLGYSRRGRPETSAVEYSAEELEFLRAMQVWMPTFSDALSVARSLGYRKCALPEAEARVEEAVPRRDDDELGQAAYRARLAGGRVEHQRKTMARLSREDAGYW